MGSSIGDRERIRDGGSMGGGDAGQDDAAGEEDHGEEIGEDCGDIIGGGSDEQSEICIAGEGEDLGEHCGESIGGGILFEALASRGGDASEASSESLRESGWISTDGTCAGGGATLCLGVKDGA